MSAARLPNPPVRRTDITAWVDEYLGHLVRGPITASHISGGQRAADAALATFDVTGYARTRNAVRPIEHQGASRLSPYIRHGLLTLERVRNTVTGPSSDVEKFRQELLWQEYARHVYARINLAQPARFTPPHERVTDTNPWESAAHCLQASWAELQRDGWLTNQQRMWLSSHWQVREGLDWRSGEHLFFQHLLDGSRAANRVGWQWVSGALTGKSYGFSRWQVRERAPQWCEQCPLSQDCPIEHWPDSPEPAPRTSVNPLLRKDPDPAATAGPHDVEMIAQPQVVWLTAESLGDEDPALAAHPDLPVIFVFDEPLLAVLRLSGKRLVFLAETLAELAQHRDLRVSLGRPEVVLADSAVAVTFAPVPGFRRRMRKVNITALHPWPWLVRPHGGPVTSFTAWSRGRR